MDLSAFYNQFRDETAENIRILSDGLLALERMNDRADPAYRNHVDAIFRAVHTIKGSARVLGFGDVGRVAHTMEHVLGSVRAGERVIDGALASDLLRGGDALLALTQAAVEGRSAAIDVTALVGSFDTTSSVAPPSTPLVATSVNDASAAPDTRTSRRAAAPRQTVRVRIDRLDRLLNLTGELALEYQTQVAYVHAIQELHRSLAEHERMLSALSAEADRMQQDAAGWARQKQGVLDLWAATRRLRQTLLAQSESMVARTNHHGLLIDDLEREVVAVRLVPVSTMFATLPRAVRELARELGKEVALVIEGEATELDRKLLEAIADPLVHLVRNAIDHGIEPPDERVTAGKERSGTVTVSASALGGEVRIVLRDDGRGIDPDMVRASAIRKGLVSQQAAAVLNNQEVLELLFTPGFSTASIITDLSGRGVGLDVVRTNVGELGGQTLIESQPGHGTTITLVLPLTLVTTRVLLIELAGVTYGIPASGCRSIRWTLPRTVQSIEGQACIAYGERTVPLLRLADLLGVPGQRTLADDERIPTIVVGTQQRLVALLVDRLDDEREAVVKPMGPIFDQRRRYGGALQLGDGRLVLLLNPLALAHEARGMAVAAKEIIAPRRRARLLVVDDSFATRELIRSILQSAGYDVAVAINGADALDKLKSMPYDLVVSDVEMPNMNGFQLTERIKREQGLRDIPVIIVTSLDSDEYKRQGLEAGAQAYLIKSHFQQDTLLDTIRQLLGHEPML